MSECKFHIVAEELKNRIRSKLYLRKLPGIRDLSEEFKASTRTVGKALSVLKQCNFVTTDKGGIHIVHRKFPDVSRKIAVISTHKISLPQNDMAQFLKELIENNGDEYLNFTVPETGSKEYKDLGVNPPLSGVIFLGTYESQLAQKLRKRNIPMVSFNRLPENENASWADWDHTAEFTSAVEFLVKQGFRRIAFFQYLYPNLMEHWLLIQHDFDRVAREFQLRNPDLEVFVKEHGWDCSAFLDFWQHEPQLPEVIVRIGKEANDLKAEMAKRNLDPQHDVKILLVKFAPAANKVWAEAVWKLLQQSRRNPLAPAKQKLLKPLRTFEWL